MELLKKHDQNPYADLFWNLPETKKGTVNVLGGNAQSFQTVVRTAEFLAQHYPVATVNVVLPDSLRSKLPNLPNFQFLPATSTGSFSGAELPETLATADFNLLLGDLSKNRITSQAFAQALAAATQPVLITRDAIDLLTDSNPAPLLLNPNLSFLATAQQLQKLLRAIYYPKVMTLSQSLLQIAELLHKFTLSFAVGLVTFHSGQILVAQNGRVEAVPLAASGFSPITLWSGTFAARITALNLFNPHNFVPATVAAVFHPS